MSEAISNVLAQQVGINEQENALWTDMELAGLSVMIHCKLLVFFFFFHRFLKKSTHPF
jgi:hypothetical protein